MTEPTKQALSKLAAQRLRHASEIRKRRNELTPEAYHQWVMDDENHPVLPSVPGETIVKLWQKAKMAQSIGERIAAIRKHYRMTQSEFSELLNVKQASVSRWEKNVAEPTEENLLSLADLLEAEPSMLRYGPVEPTTSGSFIPENPVKVVGFVNELGAIFPPSKIDEVVLVARPRECRPHDDVVAIQLETNTTFGIFQHPYWTFFYRTSLTFFPDDHQRQLGVIKLRDQKEFFIGIIAARYEENGKLFHSLLMPYGGLTEPQDVEWISPIISIRQSVYPVDLDDGLYATPERVEDLHAYVNSTKPAKSKA